MNKDKKINRYKNTIVRLPREEDLNPIKHHIKVRKISVRGPKSPMILIYGFLLINLIGSILLTIPFSTTDGSSDFIIALYTSTSAITVTGLTLVDTSTYWSFFGQLIIIILCFIGGLGFMMAAAFIIILTGQKLSLNNRLLIRDGLGGGNLGSITIMIKYTVILAVGLQIIGILLLFLKWHTLDKLWEGITWIEALWQSVFHGISAYNNAGFDIIPENLGENSLEYFSNDPLILLILGILIFFGGIGFLPIRDIYKKKSFSKLELESKVVLYFSFFLTILGGFLFFITESNNHLTIENNTFLDKISISLFQSISTRTAGFAITDYSNILSPTIIISCLLMIIGGATASTAGGIKINTFAIIFLATASSLVGRKNITAFRRRIPFDNVVRAFSITVLFFLSLLILSIIIFIFEPNLSFEHVIFEMVSAIGNNGLSSGISQEYTITSKIIVIFTMFLGRFGPLTLILLLAGKTIQPSFEDSEERIRIG
ncbi:MAG: hypothetical protein CL778_01530 [Chloroflexi bacterium]|nr:hypothetical protein [Chloroflexota bacterium]